VLKVADVPVMAPIVLAPKVLEPKMLVRLFPITTGYPAVLLMFKSTPSLFIVFKYEVINLCNTPRKLKLVFRLERNFLVNITNNG
jgi:hypothetical protein